MKIQINRYSFEKELIISGFIYLFEKESRLELRYQDKLINVSVFCSHHPLMCLEKPRLELEFEHNSLLNLMGCRYDTAYRPEGGYRTYLLEMGKPATKRVNIFKPTEELGKLSAVEMHKKEYNKWLASLGV